MLSVEETIRVLMFLLMVNAAAAAAALIITVPVVVVSLSLCSFLLVPSIQFAFRSFHQKL